MSARTLLRLAGAALPLLAAFGLLAQQTTARDGYHTAFRAWREAEPELERDAATPNPALATRATHAAAGASTYGAARGAFLRQFADDQGQNVLWLQNNRPLHVPEFVPAAELHRLVGIGTSNVTTTLTTFAGDTDRGIQQLRTALEKERAALAALDMAITDRQTAQDKVAQSEDALGPVAAKALSEYQSMTDALLGSSASLVDQETAGWSRYYPALSSTAPVTVTPSTGGAATAVVGAPTGGVTSSAVLPSGPRAANLPPLPLTRYTGVWVYPTVNGRFFGAEPDFVDFTVHEENGHVAGAFYARFKLPPGSTGDPVLRFDFSGDFQPTARQSFPLMTADGSAGTIELIPGNAFNLLEINFQSAAAGGKVRAADLVLVKK